MLFLVGNSRSYDVAIERVGTDHRRVEATQVVPTCFLLIVVVLPIGWEHQAVGLIPDSIQISMLPAGGSTAGAGVVLPL